MRDSLPNRESCRQGGVLRADRRSLLLAGVCCAATITVAVLLIDRQSGIPDKQLDQVRREEKISSWGDPANGASLSERESHVGLIEGIDSSKQARPSAHGQDPQSDETDVLLARRVDLLLRSQEKMIKSRTLPGDAARHAELGFLGRCVGAILLESGRGEVLDGTARRSIVASSPNEHVVLVDDHVYRFSRGEFPLYDAVYDSVFSEGETPRMNAISDDRAVPDFDEQAQQMLLLALAALDLPEAKESK